MISTEDKKYLITLMIQTEDIKQYASENIYTIEKHNQSIRIDLGTMLPITPERIGGRPIIYQTVSIIKKLW